MRSEVSPCFFGVPNQNGVYQISFEITNRCNLRCVHCMNKSDNSESTNDGLPWEQMSQLLDEMSCNNVKELYITGGEPTLYPNFEKLVAKSKHLGMDTLLATNAYDIESQLNVIKKYVDVVFVSIDGTPLTHNRFRGMSDAYEKSMSNIKKMISLGVPVRISTVVSKNNLNDLECIVKEVCGLGVFQLHFTVLVNVGRAASGEMQLDATGYREITLVIEDLRRKYEKRGFVITSRRNGKLCRATEPCYGGLRMAHMTASAVLSPCSYVSKCQLGDKYNIQWKPGELKKCLDHVKSFQTLCDKRDTYFGHSSCAALASITAGNSEIYNKDPLDIIW